MKKLSVLMGSTLILVGCITPTQVFGEKTVISVDAKTIRSRVPQLKKLSARWEQVMNARGIAGMAVVVVQGDEVIYSNTFGERDPHRNDGHDVLYRIVHQVVHSYGDHVVGGRRESKIGRTGENVSTEIQTCRRRSD